MINKFNLYMEGLPYELVYYLEVVKKNPQGKTLYRVTLKEEEQKKLFTKEVYEYFKTKAYAYGFEVVEEENSYSVLSKESKEFYDTFLYDKLCDAFFEILMN